MSDGRLWASHGGPPVVAFGGNALLPDAGDPGGAERNAAAFAAALAVLLPEDTGVVLVHGNGPQVGRGLLRAEAAHHEVPVDPLDVLVAETQGSIGYLMARSIGDAMRSAGREVAVAPIITQVVVDPEDPAMVNPTKPVGPFYSMEEGVTLAAARGWETVEVPGKGVRRVVPSPLPLEVMEIGSILDAAHSGVIVIAGGGGGIPVAHGSDGTTYGVEAVIDKDRTGALIATSIDARGFVILTEVDTVYLGFGTPEQRPLLSLTIDEAQRHLDTGEFPPGSMGPKIEACIAYASATGRPGLITSVEGLEGAIAGTAGTRVGP
ncbi:MAG TPA: carbamate kinase [Acidimicrobiia bacterium]|nr:carbamate kinase [Acidimicrobiia bacterium]